MFNVNDPNKKINDNTLISKFIKYSWIKQHISNNKLTNDFLGSVYNGYFYINKIVYKQLCINKLQSIVSKSDVKTGTIIICQNKNQYKYHKDIIEEFKGGNTSQSYNPVTMFTNIFKTDKIVTINYSDKDEDNKDEDDRVEKNNTFISGEIIRLLNVYNPNIDNYNIIVLYDFLYNKNTIENTIMFYANFIKTNSTDSADLKKLAVAKINHIYICPVFIRIDMYNYFKIESGKDKNKNFYKKKDIPLTKTTNLLFYDDKSFLVHSLNTYFHYYKPNNNIKFDIFNYIGEKNANGRRDVIDKVPITFQHRENKNDFLLGSFKTFILKYNFKGTQSSNNKHCQVDDSINLYIFEVDPKFKLLFDDKNAIVLEYVDKIKKILDKIKQCDTSILNGIMSTPVNSIDSSDVSNIFSNNLFIVKRENLSGQLLTDFNKSEIKFFKETKDHVSFYYESMLLFLMLILVVIAGLTLLDKHTSKRVTSFSFGKKIRKNFLLQ